MHLVDTTSNLIKHMPRVTRQYAVIRGCSVVSISLCFIGAFTLSDDYFTWLQMFRKISRDYNSLAAMGRGY